MIDPISEETFPLNEIGKKLGIRKHCSTFHRWRHPGVRDVRLEAIRFGGVWYTSASALMRFLRALSQIQEKTQTELALDSEREAQIVQQLQDRFGI
jgi:hypothetical protein